VGVSKLPCFGGHPVLRPQACDLHKRADRLGRVQGLWGMRGEVWVRTIVLGGLARALTCGYGGVGGYVIAVETNTIALDNSGVTRRLGPTETDGPFRSSTLACGLAVGHA